MTDGHHIHKINRVPFAVLETYHYPDLAELSGIAYDGSAFYLLGNAELTGSGAPIWQVVRVSLP